MVISYSYFLPGFAQLPLDTGFRILSPKFFPGWQAQHVSYPFVMYDTTAGKYKMYYAGSSSTQVNESLWDQWVTGVVTSTNSLNWIYPENYEQVLFARKFMEGDVVNPEEQAKLFHDELRMKCNQLKIDFISANSRTDYFQVLQAYLIKRAKMK